MHLHEISASPEIRAAAMEQQCPYCGIPNKFENLFIIKYKAYDFDGYASLNRCTTKDCKKISMFLHGPSLDKTTVAMPQRYKGLDASIPKYIHESYIEAMNCLNNQFYTSAAIMFRRTIELSAVILGEIDGGLKKKIAKLRERALITEQMQEWAMRIKILGDEGAHPEILISNGRDVMIDPDDVIEAQEFCEAYLNYVYVLPSKIRRPKQ